MIGYTSDAAGSQGTPEGFELFFPAAAAEIAARESRGDFMFFVGDDDPEMLGHLRPAAAAAAGLPLIGVQFDQTLRESLALDAACEWDEQGRDTSAPGLWCSGVGIGPDGGRRCRPLCESADDCAEGEACPWPGIEIGTCTDPCDPIGQDCAAGTICVASVGNDRVQYGLYCGAPGEVPEGQPWGGSDRCQAGLQCGNTFALPADIGCVAWCRPSDPVCAIGRSCRRMPRPGLPVDLGGCLSDDRLAP